MVARVLMLLSFKPITEAAGALQVAVNVVGANKDDANDTAPKHAYVQAGGYKVSVLSRVVAFSSKRKYSGPVTGRTESKLLMVQPVCAWS